VATTRRDWTDALEAHRDMPCRVCCRWPRQLAHILGRAYDEGRGAAFYVHPLAVCPLCQEHHQLYDVHALNLLPHLLAVEVEFAVRRVGEGVAMRRILGPAWRQSTVG
jgi:hypothetical protein